MRSKLYKFQPAWGGGGAGPCTVAPFLWTDMTENSTFPQFRRRAVITPFCDASVGISSNPNSPLSATPADLLDASCLWNLNPRDSMFNYRTKQRRRRNRNRFKRIRISVLYYSPNRSKLQYEMVCFCFWKILDSIYWAFQGPIHIEQKRRCKKIFASTECEWALADLDYLPKALRWHL